MDKTRFSNVCKCLAQLWTLYKEEAQEYPEWNEFFTWADIGLPLAYAKDQGLVTGVKEEGKQLIEDTWKVFCEMISIDPDGDYISVMECFGASPNRPASEAKYE